MNLGQLKVTYVDHMGTDLRPVQAARISFANTSFKLVDKDIKLINYLAKHKHLTPFEHQVLTIVVECPLYIRSQIHRHRTFAYNEVSRRYTEEGIEFYLPPVEDIRSQSQSNKQGSGLPLDAQGSIMALGLMEQAVEQSFNIYERLLELGVCKEQARGILPQCLMTKFYMTGNLRNLVNYVNLRLDSHAQSEGRVIAQGVAEIIKGLWPESYKALLENV